MFQILLFSGFYAVFLRKKIIYFFLFSRLQAVRFLHERGVIVHFDDSLKLNDVYFLNPEWLCRMMAQVVTLRQINPYVNEQGVSKQGVFVKKKILKRNGLGGQ